MVNILSPARQAEVINALCEGVSIRATERLTGVNRNTIMRLAVQVGQGCEALHNDLLVNLQIGRIELDEIWSFVKKKNHNVTATDPDTVGNQWIFVAMDSVGKALICWHIGKRDRANTNIIVAEARRRVISEPEISSDGFNAYPNAIEKAFGGAGSYGIVDKKEVIIAKGPDSDDYYAKQKLVKIERTPMYGNPQKISTSFIERQNLTMRMSVRRLTRQTNAFSKKFENHTAAVALYSTHYNFCRVHETLRVTPAMHLGITDHIWSISELTTSALAGRNPEVIRPKRPAFQVIQGGRN